MNGNDLKKTINGNIEPMKMTGKAGGWVMLFYLLYQINGNLAHMTSKLDTIFTMLLNHIGVH